ncbi:hypothetical protein J7E71_15175 [Mesobacillus foraminis]|uniref:hypothetical protein n=1 Tax=Mesobacillus foraminis TaxID=279826 RepID=UPI001BE55001|nr:hypothetical protein [Mesobacillus foraminis]MBT2757269.1 hypothetical protein [Mesobacillus foraminis]
MELMLQRVTSRSRKYLFILLAIPVLFGLLGWFLPVGREPSLLTAEATISLGNYDHPDLNNPKNVMDLLSNAPFYEENLAGLWEETEEPITENLTIANVSDKVLQLTYTGTSGENAAEVVNAIADAFLKMDKERYEEKKAIIKGTIDSLEGETVAEEAKVDQERFLYELKSFQLNMKAASFVKRADLEEAEMSNKALSSRDRAVLGVLLGVTLAFSWMIVPELVRKQ